MFGIWQDDALCFSTDAAERKHLKLEANAHRNR
jgi:hypothetical protein